MIYFTDNLFKFNRIVTLFTTPHILYTLSIGMCKFALTSKHIFHINIALIFISNKIFGKLFGIEQALKTAVHVASISRIY